MGTLLGQIPSEANICFVMLHDFLEWEAQAPRRQTCWRLPRQHSDIQVRLTLYGQVRYPLLGGCRCRPMQPMGSRLLAPKGMRCNGSGGLYGRNVCILYRPGIAG
jgi:hypothetical protein